MKTRGRAGVLATAALSSLLVAADWPGRALALRQEYATADPERRLQIVLDLPAAASEARDELLRRGLEDDDPRVQRAALRTATRVRATALVDAVATWLEGGPAARRALAAEALGHLGDGRAAPALTRALGDADPAVRAAAATALGRLGGSEADLVLFDRTHDPETPVRLAAVQALGALADPRSVFALLGALQDPVPELRVAAVRALGALRDPRAVRGIVGLLHDAQPDVARAAVAALASLGAEAHEAADALAPLALGPRREGDARAQLALARDALAALGRIGGPVARTVLVRALADEADPALVTSAAAALEALGPEALPDLLAALGGLREGRRAALVPLLGRLGGDDSARALVGMLDRAGPSAAARGPLLRALGQTGSPVALDPLLRALPADLCVGAPRATPQPLADPVVALQSLAARRAALPSVAIDPLAAALRRCEAAHSPQRAALAALLGTTRDARAAQALAPLLDDPTPPVRAAAVRALGALPDGALAPLLRALGDADPTVRAESLDALSARTDPDTAEALAARLRDPAPLDRAGVTRALGRIAVRLRATHPDAALRAADALRAVAPDAPAALRAARLEALADSDHPDDRDALIEGLGVADRTLRLAAVEAAGHHLAAASDPRPVADALRALRERPEGREPASRSAIDWALGHHGATRGEVVNDLDDTRPEVAGAAAGALALGPVGDDTARSRLCARVAAGHPLVRSNAAHALAVQGWRCDGVDPASLVARERSPLLRAAAARWLRRIAPEAPATARALARCAAHDPDAQTRAACEPPRGATISRIDVRVLGNVSEGTAPARVVLVRPDGVLRWAVPGPDGWLHERPVPAGDFRVMTPEALADDQ